MFTKEEDCYETVTKFCACIEFRPDEDRRHGFSTGQLIHYELEPNPEAGDGKNSPDQKLIIAFSTADVVILGWRLGRVADHLRDSNLAVVRSCAKIPANFDHQETLVTSIEIRPILKQ